MSDSLDLKIIKMLQTDARIPLVDIARQLGVSRGVVQARYNKMKKSGLIIGTTLTLNRAKMEKMYVAGIGVEAYESDLKEVMDFINSLKIEDAIVSCWVTFGRFNISSAIISKNLIEVHKIKQQIMQHPSVKDASINLTNANWFFHERLNVAGKLEE